MPYTIRATMEIAFQTDEMPMSAEDVWRLAKYAHDEEKRLRYLEVKETEQPPTK